MHEFLIVHLIVTGGFYEYVTSLIAVSKRLPSIIVMSYRIYASGSSTKATVRRILPLCTVSWSNLAPKFQSWWLVQSLRQGRLWKLIRCRKVKRYQIKKRGGGRNMEGDG